MSRRNEKLLKVKRTVAKERFGANRKEKKAELNTTAFAHLLFKKPKYKRYLTATGRLILVHPKKDVKKDNTGQPYIEMGSQRMELYT